MIRRESALELFFRFANRYPKIHMKPIGFGGFTEADRFYLEPQRDGEKLYRDWALVGYPYVDVQKARIRARTDYKPETRIVPNMQLREAFRKKIEAELKKRQFTIHFRRADLVSYYNVPLGSVGKFPARFRVWRQMRGLVLLPTGERPVYLSWEVFVPFGTKEHDLISMKLELENGRRGRGARSLSVSEWDALQVEYDRKLAAVDD